MNTHNTRYQGLNEEEVKNNRTLYGENTLTPPKRESIWKLYLDKFNDPVIKILLIAACFSLIISIIENEYAETIGIIFAIFLATGIGFYFEYDASKKFDLLSALGEENGVKVIRNGGIHVIPQREVVVGDIVIIENGEEIPADGILLEATSLQVNESNLTGELMVEKTINQEDFDADATYPSNLVMRGTTVVDGHGIMQVLQVGDNTEIGKVAHQATEKSNEETPLNIQLTRLANLIGKVGFAIAGITFLVFVTRDLYGYFQQNIAIDTWQQWMEVTQIILKYFMMSVTLIVVCVPEGLPMSVTLSLALNMRRMLATNNLVRKMHACETMGAVTVICTDKTGTLTQNRMQVYEAYFPVLGIEQKKQPSEASYIYENMAINSTAFLEREEQTETLMPIGNPTEAALLLWLHKEGVNYEEVRNSAQIVHQLPFSTEKKIMATLIIQESGKHVLYLKGAPEILLKQCHSYLAEDGIIHPLKEHLTETEKLLNNYQNMAMRTLGFAMATIESNIEDTEKIDCEELISNTPLIFVGIVAISDPIRPDVPTAVAKCQSAGINIKIVTGDTPGTATEIARQIGLWTYNDTEKNRITGTEFANLSDEEALNRIMDLKIMSRARPSDKQRLVQLLQQREAVVAVTGDGTNDAPALNHAQVGLSMGTGTSVAKEASDITLLDDSFNSISTAVMWGRSLYKNIQRFIVFQLTINVIALAIVLIGAIMGTAIPLTVTQMLWINLIMDTFAALALASIPPSEDVMKDKPRKKSDFIITSSMYRNIVGMSLLFLSGLIILYTYLSTNQALDTYGLTIFFTTFVMLQVWNLFNARFWGTNDTIFKKSNSSHALWFVIFIILIGQIIIVQYGGSIFRTVPLHIVTWLQIIIGTSFVFWGGEFVRFIHRRKKR